MAEVSRSGRHSGLGLVLKLVTLSKIRDTSSKLTAEKHTEELATIEHVP